MFAFAIHALVKHAFENYCETVDRRTRGEIQSLWTGSIECSRVLLLSYINNSCLYMLASSRVSFRYEAMLVQREYYFNFKYFSQSGRAILPFLYFSQLYRSCYDFREYNLRNSEFKDEIRHILTQKYTRFKREHISESSTILFFSLRHFQFLFFPFLDYLQIILSIK